MRGSKLLKPSKRNSTLMSTWVNFYDFALTYSADHAVFAQNRGGIQKFTFGKFFV